MVEGDAVAKGGQNMKRIRGHDTNSLVIPKVAILEAVRMAAGSRQNIVEVSLPHVLAAETLSYEGHLAKYGFPLEPGHSQKFEHYVKPIGYPVPRKSEEDPGEEKEQGRAFIRPPLGNKGVPCLPVLGKRGQGQGGKRGRDRKPRNLMLGRIVTRDRLRELCPGHTQGQIAQKFGCSQGYICHKLKAFGLKALPGNPPCTDKDAELTRLVLTKSVTEISQALGISRKSVHQKLRRLKLTAVHGKSGRKPEKRRAA